MTQEELDINEQIDYKPGDWVETCDLLPGIVEFIDYRTGTVNIFYPHYAFKYPGQYGGHSHCSVWHCGVHKITPQYACKLLALGRDKLSKLWDEVTKENHDVINWEENVERCYRETIEAKYK